LRKELLAKYPIISTAEEKQIFTSFVRRGKGNKKKKKTEIEEYTLGFSLANS